MRVVFFATGAFAIPSLEALAGAGHEIAALVTQPDRESGRGRVLTPPRVKPVAERLGIPVLQIERVRAPEAQAKLRELRPELSVVVAFGQILPRAVIDVAPRGTINVHASLLPRWRGAAPIQWAIASGDATTGVTTMQIDEGLDTGPLLLAREVAIGPRETASELEPRLARLGGELLVLRRFFYALLFRRRGHALGVSGHYLVLDCHRQRLCTRVVELSVLAISAQHIL